MDYLKWPRFSHIEVPGVGSTSSLERRFCRIYVGESSRLSAMNDQVVFEYRCRSSGQAIMAFQGSKWKLLIKQVQLR